MVKEIKLSDRIKNVLKERGSTQRFFLSKLANHGLHMSDSTLSNKLNGLRFTDEEAIIVEKVLDEIS
jgi:hypothetical protein